MGSWEIAGVVMSALVGASGLIVALLAQRRAREANELAKGSNDIAASAVRQAEESNRIAKDANELSENANKVVTVQAAQQVEQWLVEWKAEWDGELGVFTIVNQGRDVALHTTVAVRGPGVNELSDGIEDVVRGGEIRLSVPSLVKQRVNYEVERARTHRAMSDQGIFYGSRRYFQDVIVTIYWRTGLGKPQEQVINLKVE